VLENRWLVWLISFLLVPDSAKEVLDYPFPLSAVSCIGTVQRVRLTCLVQRTQTTASERKQLPWAAWWYLGLHHEQNSLLCHEP
jgi:hypothetical protein